MIQDFLFLILMGNWLQFSWELACRNNGTRTHDLFNVTEAL